MGRKKTTEDQDQIPLSETQNTALTGRTGGIPVLSGTVDEIKDKLDKALKKAKDENAPQAKAIEIKSAELVDQLFCNYKYKHTVGPNTTNSVATKSEVPVHPDLVFHFRKLDAHLAVICEEVDPALIDDIDNIDNQITAGKIAKFEVTRFMVDGPMDSLTLILSGLKELSTGESIKLETPKVNVDASYPFATELAITLQYLISEVEEYMKGKQAESPQLEIEFSNTDKLVEEGL